MSKTLTITEKNDLMEQYGDLYAFCTRRVAAYDPQALKLSGMRCEAVWNGRLSASMGRAKGKNTIFGTTYKIEFSPKLFALATPEARRNTMIHEICHVLGHALSGKMDHGRVWKRLMVICGESPERCYRTDEKTFGANAAVATADSKARKRGRRERTPAKCGCLIGPVQLKRLKAGAVYHCRHGKLTKEMI
jgi:predicted SprT family Zn-dependent metalloprotease